MSNDRLEWLHLTAFGKPVVPLLKFRNAQTSLFVLRGGNWYGRSAFMALPRSISCWIVWKPFAAPWLSKIFSFSIPLNVAALVAFSIALGTAMTMLVFATLRA